MFRTLFGKTFQNAISSPGGAAVEPWYLTGGIAAANCLAAYDFKNAASLAAGCVNLASPGTKDLIAVASPSWSAGVGVSFNGSTQYLYFVATLPPLMSAIIRFSGGSGNAIQCLMGCSIIAPSTGAWLITPQNSVNQLRWFCSWGNFFDVAPQATSGILAATSGPVGGAGGAAWRNGTPELSGKLHSNSNGLAGMAIGARLSATTPAIIQPCVFTVQEAALYNIDFSAYVAGLTTAIGAL